MKDNLTSHQISSSRAQDFSAKSVVLDQIINEQDEKTLLALGIKVEHNYYITQIYVKDPQEIKYVSTGLVAKKMDEPIEIEDEEVLQVVHAHLTKLNDDLSRLHERVTERLNRIVALEKENANA